MTTVTIHKAKTELSKLIALAERGEEVIIARGRTPVARIVPYAPEQPKRGFGSMKGRHDRPGVLETAAGGRAEALGGPLRPYY
jgi:prevent-host-death family protein